MIAEVIVDYRTKNLDKKFDYAVPEELEEKLTVGSCVIVPFGRGDRQKEAYVTAIKDSSRTSKLKKILRISKEIRLFDEKQLELIEWMRSKYLVTYLDAVRAVAPSGAAVYSEEWIELADAEKAGYSGGDIIKILRENDGAMEINRLMSRFEANVKPGVLALEKRGALRRVFRDRRNVRDKVISAARTELEGPRLAEAMKMLEKSNAFVQAKMLDILSSCEYLSLSDLVNFSDGSYNALRTLEKKGYIETFEITVMRTTEDEYAKKCEIPSELTGDQKKVLKPMGEALSGGDQKTFLLHGVTGSGKTEVYMRLIEKAVSLNKQAIVLVPEISLTPQMASRFKGRFGDNVAILHSGLSLGEKYDEWKRIRAKEANIVLGARSAVFAPLDDIGVIIIDEEHEQTYKSEMTPRYDAREIAEFRAKQYGSVLVLASATPLVTDYYKAEKGDIQLLEMMHRYNNSEMPHVYTVDLRSELENGNKSVLSTRLQEEIAKNLEEKKQTILFLNRRGFSTFVSCRKCGYVAECPNCSISLTYHKYDDTLRCHYCGHTIKNYKLCPSCGSKYIRYFGGGTQKVEEEVHRLFPDATTIRMDVDTTGKKNAHSKILNRFEKEKIDILIGTQMVTKGLDFPEVTLVGVISADTILNIDDYRSQERTFAVLEQVTGRAGRAQFPGKSIIQTYSPDSKAIKLVESHDYKAFYGEEIEVRRALWYPPFCEMISVIFSGANERAVKGCANAFAMQFSEEEFKQKVQKLGPIPAYVSKIKNKYIYRMIIKCENSVPVGAVLAKIQNNCRKAPYDGVMTVIDMNPNRMI